MLYNKIMCLDYVTERIWLQIAAFTTLELIYCVIYFILMILIYRVFNSFFKYKNEEFSGGELALVLLPILPAVGGYWVIVYFEATYENENNSYFWRVHSEYNWITLLYQLISFGAIIATVYFSQSIKQTRREEKERAVLQKQFENIKRHI